MKRLLIFSVFFFLLFFFFSSFSSKPALALTCSGQSACQCNGSTCQKQLNTVSQSTIVCGGAANTPCCVYEWAGGSGCSQTACNGGNGCGPVAKYKCDTTATPPTCKADPTGTDLATCQASCGGGGGGGGGSAPPPQQYPIGDGSSCYGANATCKPGGVDLSGRSCCPGFVCIGVRNESAIGNPSLPPYDYTCTPESGTNPNVTNCNGSSCDTAVGTIPTATAGFIQKLFAVLLSISGGIAIILIIISGYKFMTSRGNPEQLQVAREQLTAAVVGLLFIIFSLVILQVIGLDILKLPGFTQ